MRKRSTRSCPYRRGEMRASLTTFMSKITFSKVHDPRRPSWFRRESASFRWQGVIVGAATLTGLVLRLYRLGAAPLSSQEIYTWDFAHQTVPFIVGRLSHIETNPSFVLPDDETRHDDGRDGISSTPSVSRRGYPGDSPGLYPWSPWRRAEKRRDRGRTGFAERRSQSPIAVRPGLTRLCRTHACSPRSGRSSSSTSYMVNRSTAPDRRDGRSSDGRYSRLASIVGFYLHYTFAFEILVLECAIAVAIATGWLAGTVRIDRALVVRWLASSFFIARRRLGSLPWREARRHSDNIAWMQIPSLREAIRLLIHVDGYGALFRFQPLPSLLLIGLACIGLLAGWRRSAAVLVLRMLFAMFPLILFIVSQNRPMFIERSLVGPSFAVCLLAGYGSLFLPRKLSEYGSRFLERSRLGYGDSSFLRADPGRHSYRGPVCACHDFGDQQREGRPSLGTLRQS